MPQDPPIQIAASPINWRNDDFPILGGNTPIDQILREMQKAGYAGTELGGTFPLNAKELKPLLDKYDLKLAAGWHSIYLLSKPFEEEKKRFLDFLTFLKEMGTSVMVVAEATYCPFKPFPPTQKDPEHFDALAKNLFPYALPFLNTEQWDKLCQGFEEFAKIAADHGIKMGYHPHIQTVVQDLWQLERLIEGAPSLSLCIDTGHLALAGANPLEVVKKYTSRIVHMHTKNLRTNVAARVRTETFSFEWAVIEGVFTVPGDGGIDFGPIFKTLKKAGYEGWLVVEDEQNPLTSRPYLYAKLAREYIRKTMGW